jgi:hypothetical protein
MIRHHLGRTHTALSVKIKQQNPLKKKEQGFSSSTEIWRDGNSSEEKRRLIVD